MVQCSLVLWYWVSPDWGCGPFKAWMERTCFQAYTWGGGWIQFLGAVGRRLSFVLVMWASPFIVYCDVGLSTYCLLVTQSCQTLCNPMDCSLPGPYVRGVLQARILEWAAISFSRRSSQTRDQSQVSCISGRILHHWAPREALIFVWQPSSACSLVLTEVKTPQSSLLLLNSSHFS